ncbi:MAG TPA: MFS transporter [Microlunatus sp.]|nr:MFS transporter [Microlunatus sp.]
MTPRRSIVGLLSTIGIATVGLRVAAIAIPWFVLTTSGSAVQTGLVVAAELGPYVLAKATGGPLVDRLGQRRVSVAADVLSAGLFALIPLLHHLGALPLPALLVIVAVAGALRGPGDAAKHTMAPLVARAAGTPLTRVTGLLGATERSAGLVGPGLAALLITAYGPPATVLVTAVCFGISAVVVLTCVPTTIAGPRPVATDPETYLMQLREGWQFLVRDRLLFGLAVMIAVTNLLDVAKTSVLLPVWARDTGHGIAVIGLLLTCMAGAQVVSSVFASWLGDRLPRRTTYFVAFFIAGPPPYLVLGLDVGLGVVVTTYVVAGLASGLLNPMLGAIIFERVPERMLGRVTAPLDALAYAGMPFGGLVAAVLVATAGLGPALLVSAGVYAVAILVPAIGNRASFDPPPPDTGAPDREAVMTRASTGASTSDVTRR